MTEDIHEYTALVKDYYTKDKSFKVGQTVIRDLERSTNTVVKDVIEEIIYEEYESELYTAKKAKELGYYKHLFTEEDFQSGNFFEIRSWKPWFKMQSGNVVKYDMYLRKIVEDI